MSEVQSLKNCKYLWKLFCTCGRHDHKFSICTFSGIAEVLGAMATGSDPVRWTGSDTALGYTQSVTGTGLRRPVQEVSPLMGSGSVGPGRTGLHSAEGRVQGLGVDFSCDHPAALPGSLFPPPLAGWDPPLAVLVLLCSWAPKASLWGRLGLKYSQKISTDKFCRYKHLCISVLFNISCYFLFHMVSLTGKFILKKTGLKTQITS